MVTDSAGVQVIVNAVDAPQWSLSVEPILSLGVVEGGGPTEFFRIRDIEILSDGRVAVANRGSEEVRIFSPDGRHLLSFGQAGRGPEEFLRLAVVEEWGDSLLVYDEGNDRLQVRAANGDFARSFRLEWSSGSLFPADLSSNGIVLGVTGRYMTQLEGTGRVVDTALVSLYDLTGLLIDSVVRLPHNERFVSRSGDAQTTVGFPFSSRASLVSTGEGFCYAFGPDAEFECFSKTGELRRIARVSSPRRRVEEADVAWFWEDQRERANQAYWQALTRLRTHLTFPDFFPAISQLVLDDHERLWARRYRLPRDQMNHEEWWVFEDGVLVARLTSPKGVVVMDVEGDRVAGVWTDDLGVEHVRVYELIHRGADPRTWR